MALASTGFDRVFGVIIDGVHTDIVIHRFTNKLFLLITQYEKIPNIFVTKKARSLNMQVNNDSNIQIEHYFGRDNDEISAGMKYLLVNSGLSKTDLDIVISFGMKKIDRNCLTQLANVLKNIVT